MKFQFSEITIAPKSYSLTNDGWFSWSCAIEKVPVLARFSIVREDDETVRFEGHIAGVYITACDRCGDDVEVSLASEFSYLVTTRSEKKSELLEVECDFEDLMTVYVEEPVIDSEILLSEQAELAIPVQILCCEDCKGLCAGCGAALNNESCRCDPDKTESPFAVLKELSQR